MYDGSAGGSEVQGSVMFEETASSIPCTSIATIILTGAA